MISVFAMNEYNNSDGFIENSKYMKIKLKVDEKYYQMNWEHGETKENTQKAIKLFTKIFNENFD